MQPLAYQEFGRRWALLLTLGIVLALLGGFAIYASFVATLLTMAILGTLLLIGGVAMIAHAIPARQWGGFWMSIVLGVVYLISGLLLIRFPIMGALSLTLLMAGFFVVSGVFRSVWSAVKRFEHWGWVFANGIVNLLLGVFVWSQWPVSGLFIIGLFVGIDLLFIGLGIVMLALQAHRLSPRTY